MSRKSSKPKILHGPTIYVDVDDTLILWSLPSDYKGPTVEMCTTNRYAERYGDDMDLLFHRTLAVNTAMVEKIKEHKRAGGQVVVWSAGGAEWAAEAVAKLGLNRFVDLVADKPLVIFDDLPPLVWMPAPKYVLPEGWPVPRSPGPLDDDDK